MAERTSQLKQEIRDLLASEDSDFRRAYADSFLDSRIALQIKANRRARGWTQEKLAKRSGEKFQSQISDLEKVHNESWTIKTLKSLAAAFDLALIVKFASFGEALEDFAAMSPADLAKPPFEQDPAFRPGSSLTAGSHGEVAEVIYPDFGKYLVVRPRDVVTDGRTGEEAVG